MAASGFTPISLYHSTSATAVPVNTNLVDGELAINITDGKLYYKDNAGVVKLLASNGTSDPVTTFSGGTTGLTPSVATSGAITLGGTLAIANGGTGSTSTTFVNLTTNVTSTLPIANGGTNGTSTPTAGGAVYGTGTAYAITSAGTSGQVLTSNGTAAPTWVTPVTFVYPGAGIPNSTGTAWGTSYTTTGTGTVVALASNPTLTGFTETVFAVTGTTPALSPNNGTIQTYGLTGNSTPTFGTWGNGQSLTLMVSQETPLQGFLARSQADTNAANMGVGFKLIGATAFDPATFTYSAGSTTADSYAAASVALRPASGKSIRFVGGTTASVAGTDAASWTTVLTDLTGGIASAPAENDIVVVYYGVSSTTDVNLSITGFTELADLHANDTYDANLSVNYKIMTSVPNTSITLSDTGSTANAGVAVIFVFRNVDTTTPIDVTTTTATAINGLLIDPPAITPVTAGAVVVFGGIGAEAGTGTYSTSDINSYAITFPEIIWSGNVVPVLGTIGYTVVELWKVDTAVYGALVGNFQ